MGWKLVRRDMAEGRVMTTSSHRRVLISNSWGSKPSAEVHSRCLGPRKHTAGPILETCKCSHRALTE